jgi:hypothetical protein
LLALAASAHLRQAAGYARSSRLAWCKNSSPEMKTLFFAEPLFLLSEIPNPHVGCVPGMGIFPYKDTD